MIRNMALEFQEEKLLPFANEWDKKSYFPVEVMKEAAELGFGGIYVEEKWGGSGLKRLDASIIFEALSYGCVSTTAFLTIHNMVNGMINKYGNEEL